MVATREDLDAVFEMDEGREKDGVGIAFGKLVVKIARAGGSNKEFARVWEEQTRPYKRMIENGIDLPEDVAGDIVQQAYATAVVKDWNLVDENKQEIPCTPDNVLKEFQRRPEFFRFVFEESKRLANYRKATQELESKN